MSSPFEQLPGASVDAPPVLEEGIREKVVFKDIDLQRQAYHRDMVEGLLQSPSSRKPSLIRTILAQRGMDRNQLRNIIVETVVAEDISKGIGQKRNVDRFEFVFSEGEALVMTVSLDIAPVERLEDSPSLAEARVLERTKSEPNEALAVQAYFGSTVVQNKEGKRGLICKEYLPGKMLVDLWSHKEDLVREYGPGALEEIAHAVGQAFAQAYADVGGTPVDAHAANIILRRVENRWLARFCDVEYVRADVMGVRAEVEAMDRILGDRSSAFRKGLHEGYQATGERDLAEIFG